MSAKALVIAAGLALRGTDGAPADAVPNCDGRAALYAGEAGLKLWVTRLGSMIPDDPLRPLSKEPVMVLQVVVNGRAATAYGPTALRLVQAGAARDIEQMFGSNVRWSSAQEGLPDALGVTSPDGSQVIGPLQFRECGEAPKAAPARAERNAASSGTVAAPASGTPRSPAQPRRAMPQGALDPATTRTAPRAP